MEETEGAHSITLFAFSWQYGASTCLLLFNGKAEKVRNFNKKIKKKRKMMVVTVNGIIATDPWNQQKLHTSLRERSCVTGPLMTRSRDLFVESFIISFFHSALSV